ncbi:MAG: addiction module protein [Bacteroidales bacterium]|nr:addiction module protein [Bacteroidales bacterium]
MCKVTIDINEAVVRSWNPDLSTPDAINQWAQQEMDKIVKRLTHTAIAEPTCTYNTKAEVVAEAQRRMAEIESGKAKTIPHEDVRQRMEKMIASYAN